MISQLNRALDLRRFWAENAKSCGKPFRTDKPRCPVSVSVDDHWLIDEMKLPSTIRYFRDPEYQIEVNRACNDRCETQIGIRPFNQTPQPRPPLRIEQIFGSHFELTENATPWLEPGVSSIEELGVLLDRIEKLDDAGLKELILSRGGEIAREPPLSDGTRKEVTRWSRGPATVATSVLGTTQYLYAIIDYAAQMQRFYEVLANVLIRYHRLLAAEANVQITGFAWLDDNCALLSPPLYEQFCFPLMQRVFDTLCHSPQHWRFQHSDSAMGHLLPVLSRLNFGGVNFGPTLSAQEIRRHMPGAEIHGQLAPMTLRNGTERDVEREVQRDFAAVGADGGLLITTSGSIAAGTSLGRIRHFLWAVDTHARYDGRAPSAGDEVD